MATHCMGYVAGADFSFFNSLRTQQSARISVFVAVASPLYWRWNNVRHGEGRRIDLRAAARWLQRAIHCLREPRCPVPGAASTRAAGPPTRLILGRVALWQVLVRSRRGVACVFNTF